VTADLQATILKSHGRNFAAHVFVRQPGGLTRIHVDQLVAEIGVTSATDQQQDTARWRQDPTASSPPVHVIAFSAQGLRGLGYGEDALPGAGAFWAGMASRSALLADPEPGPGGTWAQDADLLVILADDSERILDADVDRVHTALPGAEIHVEWGQTIRRPSTSGTVTYEPFGFADGISDPEFAGQDSWARPTTDIWWRPNFPDEQVLVPWRGGEEGHGSFLVFRKLEQHIERFRAAMAGVAAADATTVADAEARAVGRYRDGTPLAVTAPGSWNDFSYALDPEGGRCPVTAHARVVNPRTSHDRGRLVARRGMPYRSLAGDEVGLLFLAFMADIEQQFEWMQGRANADGDRIAGQGTGDDLATLRGGQYFFVPPLNVF